MLVTGLVVVLLAVVAGPTIGAVDTTGEAASNPAADGDETALDEAASNETTAEDGTADDTTATQPTADGSAGDDSKDANPNEKPNPNETTTDNDTVADEPAANESTAAADDTTADDSTSIGSLPDGTAADESASETPLELASNDSAPDAGTALAASASGSNPAAPPELEIANRTPLNENVSIHAAARTGDGGAVVVGSYDFDGPSSDESDAWVGSVEPDGTFNWTRTYGGPAYDDADAVLVDNGSIVVAGETRSYGAGETDAWLLNLTTSGTERWNRTAGGPNNESVVDLVEATPGSDGAYVTLGYTLDRSSASNDSRWLHQFESDGQPVWTQVLDDPWASTDLRLPSAVVETGDGYAVTGSTDDGFATVLKVDENGHEQWRNVYNPDPLSQYFPSDMTQAADGGVVWVGDSNFFTSNRAKYRLNGSFAWSPAISGGRIGMRSGQIVAAPGGGFVETHIDTERVAVVGVDELGDNRWNLTLGLGRPEALTRLSDHEYLVATREELVLLEPKHDFRFRPVIDFDDFDDFDPDDFELLQGSPDDWAIDSRSDSDDSVLRYRGGSGTSTIASFSGLPRYPEAGDSVWFEVGTDGAWNGETSFAFGVQRDSHDRYELVTDPASDELRLVRACNTDEPVELGSASYHFDRDETYTVQIDWSDEGEEFVVTLYDEPPSENGTVQARFTADAPADGPQSGGIAFSASGEGDSWTYDDVRIGA